MVRNCYTLFVVMALQGDCALGQEIGPYTPASESPCNVSCGFDHSNYPECFERSVVIQYAMEQLLPSVYVEIDKLLSNAPADACVCAKAVVNEAGRFSAVEVVRTHPPRLGERLREMLLNSKGAPIAAGAECIVGQALPISIGD